MASPASVSDIESRWRPLSDAESTVAATLLEDAWRILKSSVSDLEARMGGDVDLADDVVAALAVTVRRVLKNPDGVVRGTVAVDDASRSFEYSGTTADDDLYFTDAQLARLVSPTESATSRAFSVMPS